MVETQLPDVLDYRKAYVPPDEATEWLRLLRRELAWRQQEITLFGRRVMQPRLTAWYGEE
ncbi:MAG: alpha-ketoglutarate-dependent dioxygenase AlkB, partial [Gammaproteobacteria bacterium]|nr:alpha-ketoglutarate-dependent dioxygenase AlkB [Gammaproteobacteria bacterium]